MSILSDIGNIAMGAGQVAMALAPLFAEGDELESNPTLNLGPLGLTYSNNVLTATNLLDGVAPRHACLQIQSSNQGSSMLVNIKPNESKTIPSVLFDGMSQNSKFIASIGNSVGGSEEIASAASYILSLSYEAKGNFQAAAVGDTMQLVPGITCTLNKSGDNYSLDFDFTIDSNDFTYLDSVALSFSNGLEWSNQTSIEGSPSGSSGDKYSFTLPSAVDKDVINGSPIVKASFVLSSSSVSELSEEEINAHCDKMNTITAPGLNLTEV